MALHELITAALRDADHTRLPAAVVAQLVLDVIEIDAADETPGRFVFRPDDGTNWARPCGHCDTAPTTHMVTPAGKIAPYTRTCENEECAAYAAALLMEIGY